MIGLPRVRQERPSIIRRIRDEAERSPGNRSGCFNKRFNRTAAGHANVSHFVGNRIGSIERSPLSIPLKKKTKQSSSKKMIKPYYHAAASNAFGVVFSARFLDPFCGLRDAP